MDSSNTNNSTTTSTTETTFPLYSTAIALPALALLTLIIDLPPFIWHIRNRNLTASTLVFYILLANLMNFINPFIWPTDNIDNWFPGFGVCDLEVKVMLGTWIGVVSCVVCIMRKLARVLNTKRTVMSLSQAQQQRQLAIDCLLCFGAPAYMMAIHYTVQSSRYYIFAISGCTSSFDDSWPALILVFIWPPIFCVINLYYAVLVIIRMRRYRTTFSAILASSSSSDLTKNKFMRLFWMSLTLIIIIFPIECFVLYKNAANSLSPYSWSRIHGAEAWAIIMVPAEGSVSFDRWIQIGAGIMVFGFFGTGQDALKGYKNCLRKMGFSRIFPSLKDEHTENQTSISSQTSYGSRARLFVIKKTPFARNSAQYSLSNNFSSPSSSSSCPHSTAPGHPSSPAELSTRYSESTAPSTPFSTEKHLAPRGMLQRLTWLSRSLFYTYFTHNQPKECNDSPEKTAIESGVGSKIEKTSNGTIEGEFQV